MQVDSKLKSSEHNWQVSQKEIKFYQGNKKSCMLIPEI